MNRLFGIYTLLLGTSMVWCGCQKPLPSSLFSTSDSKQVIGEVPSPLWQKLEPQLLEKDWFLQRQVSWQLQSWLTSFPQQNPPSALPNWQSWYDVTDIRLIFRDLYEELGIEGRQQRSRFSALAIDRRLEREHKAQSRFQKARLSHILLNEIALRELLEHYPEWEQCFRAQSLDCPKLSFPKGSALIKSAWRRSSMDYQVQEFPTDPEAFLRQLSSSEWTERGAFDPDPQKIYSISTESGARFHLVGLHLMLKLSKDWFWTTLWLGSTPGQDFAADAPAQNGLPFFRMCSIYGFESPLQSVTALPEDKAITPMAKALQSLSEPHWCSNPYLEHGENNQKTQCIGCHQWAGSFLSQNEIAQRLKDDLPSLLYHQSDKAPSDFVWSLLRGSQPLFQEIFDSIEYFDAYDPYESLAD